MARSRRSSGRFQSRAVCAEASKQQSRRRVISYRRADKDASTGFEEYAGVLVYIKLELARALRQLLQARDYQTACRIVVRHPILLLESAPELLRATAEEAERRGDSSDNAMLLDYLRILELARETAL